MSPDFRPLVYGVDDIRKHEFDFVERVADVAVAGFALHARLDLLAGVKIPWDHKAHCVGRFCFNLRSFLETRI